MRKIKRAIAKNLSTQNEPPPSQHVAGSLGPGAYLSPSHAEDTLVLDATACANKDVLSLTRTRNKTSPAVTLETLVDRVVSEEPDARIQRRVANAEGKGQVPTPPQELITAADAKRGRLFVGSDQFVQALAAPKAPTYILRSVDTPASERTSDKRQAQIRHLPPADVQQHDAAVAVKKSGSITAYIEASEPSSVWSSFRIQSESITAIRDFGIQVETARVNGLKQVRSIEKSQIRDIVILEAMHCYSFRFVLAVIVKGSSKSVLVFPNIYPGLELLLPVYRGMHMVLGMDRGLARRIKQQESGEALDGMEDAPKYDRKSCEQHS
ncbi:hypothetical protein EV182_003839 [Spiromyces aspiralis]|uniref:Uncharacterized protein n=1 Tax=Spiromyces aspiralis TaxID=68401 RepID=A0ACC1HC66_9FUNG|nr:hypothetical protein EV182_003839 [Spiromyces aspiralis]